jgi:hypothetical protein
MSMFELIDLKIMSRKITLIIFFRILKVIILKTLL